MKLRSKATFGILVFILALDCAVFLGCSGTNTGGVPLRRWPDYLLTSLMDGPRLSCLTRNLCPSRLHGTTKETQWRRSSTIVLLIDGEQVAEGYKPVTVPGKIMTQRVQLKELTNPAT